MSQSILLHFSFSFWNFQCPTITIIRSNSIRQRNATAIQSGSFPIAEAMVQIIAAIKRSTKTANIESPPFYCQRLFILERNLRRLAEIVKLDFRKKQTEYPFANFQK